MNNNIRNDTTASQIPESTIAKANYYGATNSVTMDNDNTENDDNDNTKPINVNKPLEGKDHPHHSMTGVLLIMLGSFSFSVMFLIVKLMASTNFFTLVLYRSLIQLLISLASVVFHEKTNPLGPPETRFWLVLRGLAAAISICATFFGVQILPLPDAVTLQFTTPPFAAAFAVCMVGEAWRLLDMIGAIVCLTGVAFIAHPTWLFGSRMGESESDDDPDRAKTFLAVLVTTGGAAAAAVAYVLVRKIGTRASANIMVLYYGVLSIPLLFLGSGVLVGDWSVWNDVDWTPREFVLLLLMGVTGYCGQWLTYLGLQKETAATGTLATSTQVVWTYIFELSFLHDGIDPFSLVGTGLIMGYMILVGITKLLGETSSVGASNEDGLEETVQLLSENGQEKIQAEVI